MKQEQEWGYDWIKRLKKETGKNLPDLLALTHNHDPFNVGSEDDRAKANWFAALWGRLYQGQAGIHLRRIHYRILGEPKLNGMPYENTNRDWRWLQDCSCCARLLKLVRADLFDDHRNGDAYPLGWQMADVREPTCTVSAQYWSMPSLRLDFSSLDWELPKPQVMGYDPDDYLDRAYCLELWIEKSTMDDVLVPLCSELGIRLVTSVGFQSISNAVKFLQRVEAMRKPSRIFYISDYDPAGRCMPVQVSRQLQFWRADYAPGADVKLHTLVLTPDQIARYELPANENGSVELDALEARAPGVLERIVRQAVAPYLPEDIDGRLAAAKNQVRKTAEEEWSELTGPHQRRLTALRKKVASVTAKYEKEARRLNQRMKRDLAPFTKPLAKLETDVAAAAQEFQPILPKRPTQVGSEQEEADWLFDASRNYLEQLDFFKAQRQGGIR